MAEPLHPDPSTDPPRMALAWRIAPASLAFILDVRAISRRDRDLIDSLLFATIIASNVAPLTQDASLQLTYASSPAPPEARRPVSVNAVAQSMRIPFETARRRIRAMAKEGILEISPRGVVAPHSILQRPDFIQGILQRHERVGRFYRDLAAIGALDSISAAPSATADAPVLITNRLTWEYVLRMADEMIEMIGDPLSGLIQLEIIRHNIEGLAPEELAAWAHAPPAGGQPIRTGVLAARLGLSPETARRYVMGLEAAGFCARSSRGALAILPPHRDTSLRRVVLDNLSNVQRMFSRLGQLGVLSTFDRETPAAARA